MKIIIVKRFIHYFSYENYEINIGKKIKAHHIELKDIVLIVVLIIQFFSQSQLILVIISMFFYYGIKLTKCAIYEFLSFIFQTLCIIHSFFLFMKKKGIL